MRLRPKWTHEKCSELTPQRRFDPDRHEGLSGVLGGVPQPDDGAGELSLLQRRLLGQSKVDREKTSASHNNHLAHAWVEDRLHTLSLSQVCEYPLPLGEWDDR